MKGVNSGAAREAGVQGNWLHEPEVRLLATGLVSDGPGPSWGEETCAGTFWGILMVTTEGHEEEEKRRAGPEIRSF